MELGGQAVIEGVMMRNKEKFAVAVRTNKGKIKVKKEKSSKFPKIFNYPFIRGIIGLGYTVYDGVKALIWSSNQQLDKEEKFTKKEIFSTIAVSFLFALLLFVGLPFLFAGLIHSEGFWFNVLDGLFRAAIFIAYLGIVSLTKDAKKLFQYHGAEHKTIACYEAKKELTVKNVKKYSRFHPRCGTSFIFLVLILSIIFFSFLTGSIWVKLLGRIILLPVIAGVGYELIKLSGKNYQNKFVKAVIAPGLWLQKITTKEPSEKQMEVGIKALQSVLK